MTNVTGFLFLKSLHPYLKMVPFHLKLSAHKCLQSVLEEFFNPQSTSSRPPSQKCNMCMAHPQESEDRAMPTLTFQGYNATSTAQSYTSHTAELDSHGYHILSKDIICFILNFAITTD
ncbi:hypothetical protein PoB_003109800 [Plakobranchus ocellatus]|uniref:Uncharacterized protein n=1 Tax=Plakobranchus ocellatus TaxID=259542 RepID=A0AAV4ACV5_9GAST|nr:hypothetical protein PoB_003109800 [Plakobranchus ocellatus]